LAPAYWPPPRRIRSGRVDPQRKEVGYPEQARPPTRNRPLLEQVMAAKRTVREGAGSHPTWVSGGEREAGHRRIR